MLKSGKRFLVGVIISALFFSNLLSLSPVRAEESSGDNNQAQTSTDSSVVLDNNTGDTAIGEVVVDSNNNLENIISDAEVLNDHAVESKTVTPEAELNPRGLAPQNLPKPDELTGALNYEYLIITPPARNGFGPDLKLFYNSQEDNNFGMFGYGWSINIPYIERINKEGVDKFYTENYFNSSLSGELVYSDNNNYLAKVDNGEFLKYEFVNNVWLATNKQGVVYKFGLSNGSRQDDPGDSSKVFKWMLEEVRDSNGNFIAYEYIKDYAQIYPSKIKYSSHDSCPGIFEIEFLNEARSDSGISRQSAFEVKTNYRIKEINVKADNEWTRKYILGYTAGDNGTKSLLESIVESTRDELGNIITMPPDTFSYQSKIKTWTKDVSWNIPEYFDWNGDKGVRLVDVNGDGLTDMVKSYNNSQNDLSQRVYINNGYNDWIRDENWSIPLIFVWDTLDTGVHFADVNGDGLTDLLKATHNDVDNGVYINNGDNTGWTKSGSWVIPQSFYISTYNNPRVDAGTRLADINGDGLVDIVRSYKESPSSGDFKKVYLNNGSSWVENSSWDIPIIFNAGEMRMVDINGDNLVDIVKSDYSSINNGTDGVYINNGNNTGWTKDAGWYVPQFFRDNEGDNGIRLADVNGDGLVDMIQSLG